MAGVVASFYEWIWTVRVFPAEDHDWWGNPTRPYERMAVHQIVVQAEPTDEDRRLVDVPAPDHLLGLHDPVRDPAHPVVLIFASDTLSAPMDPTRVLWHELGHVIYDNPDHPTPITDSSLATPTLGNGSHRHRSFTDDCPVCLLFEKCAIAYSLLLTLDPRALLYHRIPPGWEGTLELASYRIGQAQALLPIAGPMIPDQWMVGELESRLNEAQWVLQGQLSIEALGPATMALYRALDGAADCNGSFWSVHRAQHAHAA